MIMLWYGEIANIPSGWHLCDGTMNTPDLRNRFVIGAQQDSGGYPCAIIKTLLLHLGGDQVHSHGFTGDGHAHSLQDGTYILNATPSGAKATSTFDTPAAGTTDLEYHFPECRALAFIMKL